MINGSNAYQNPAYRALSTQGSIPPALAVVIEKQKLDDLTKALKCVQSNGKCLANFPQFADHKDVVIAAINRNPEAIYWADISLKEDPKFASMALDKEPKTLEFLPDNIKNNKALVLNAVQKSGLVLEYASDALKDDSDVVEAAVKSSWQSFFFASDRLKQSGDIRKATRQKDEDLNCLKRVHSTISGRLRLQPITCFEDLLETSDKTHVIESDSNDENMKNCSILQWLLSFPCPTTR
jgi:hypothetical protein